MNLVRNALSVWPSAESRVHVERVLFLDLSGTNMVTIDIDPENNNALPVWRKCEEVTIALAIGDARILDTDPYILPAQTISDENRKHRDEQGFSQKARKAHVE